MTIWSRFSEFVWDKGVLRILDPDAYEQHKKSLEAKREVQVRGNVHG